MNIYIHIGYPKTATTFFQKKVFPLIPDATFITRKEIADYIIKPNSFLFNSDKAKEYFYNLDTKNLIISDERLLGGMFAGGFHNALTKELAYRLKAVFPQAKILIFIRNQYDIIASTYMQYIKYGGNYRVKKFLSHKNYYGIYANLSQFNFHFFDYYALIKFYRDLFGEQNVCIYLFEEFIEDTITFIHQFLKEHRFEPGTGESAFHRKENPGVRKGLIPVYKLFSLFTKSYLTNKYYLINIPYWYHIYSPFLEKLNKSKVFGKPSHANTLFDKKLLEEIHAIYKDSNKKLADEYHVSQIKKFNYPIA